MLHRASLEGGPCVREEVVQHGLESPIADAAPPLHFPKLGLSHAPKQDERLVQGQRSAHEILAVKELIAFNSRSTLSAKSRWSSAWIADFSGMGATASRVISRATAWVAARNAASLVACATLRGSAKPQ